MVGRPTIPAAGRAGDTNRVACHGRGRSDSPSHPSTNEGANHGYRDLRPALAGRPKRPRYPAAAAARGPDRAHARRLRPCPHRVLEPRQPPPALIVRAQDEVDVIAAVEYARDTGAPLAVRSGVRGFAGHGLVDDGIVIDLSAMKAMRIDPVRRIARVQPGRTWLDYAEHAQTYGLLRNHLR
ncbi:MAG: FAD-dependent oxidoreductase [Dehalococcoidia bacterium]